MKIELKARNVESLQRFPAFSRKSEKISWKSAMITASFLKNELLSIDNVQNAKRLAKTCWNIEVWAVQNHVNILDLVNSFPMSIQYYLGFTCKRWLRYSR